MWGSLRCFFLTKHPEALLHSEKTKRMETKITPQRNPTLSNQSQINWGISIKTKIGITTNISLKQEKYSKTSRKKDVCSLTNAKIPKGTDLTN